MSAPTGQPVFSTTLGEGFKLLAKAVVAIAEQMKTANQLAVIRLSLIHVKADDVKTIDAAHYNLIREQLGME